MKPSSSLNQILNALTIVVVMVCLIGVAGAIDLEFSHYDCRSLVVPGAGDGRSSKGCEGIVYSDETVCCPCNENGDLVAGACPTEPPEPPQPPTTPTPPTPPCTGPTGPTTTGGGCDEDRGSVGGKPTMCEEVQVAAAMRVAAINDFTAVASSNGDCCPSSPSTSGCSGCGGGGPGVAPTSLPSIEVTRRLMPANQVELFSFGRGMASDYDMRLTIYPVIEGNNVALLFDPRLQMTNYLEDTDDDGNYELQDDIYYSSIELTDDDGDPVVNPMLATNQSVYATVTRRNGWVYQLEVCPTPAAGGEYLTRLVSKSNPQGQSVDFTYKTFTQTELDASPARQLQIDTISDIYGNTANVSYNAQQQGGRWVISQIDMNAGEVVMDYQYTANGLLENVLRGSEVVSTYEYGTDSTYNMATLTWNELYPNSGGCCKDNNSVRGQGDSFNDSLLLSLDYQNGDETLVNQFANILQGRRNGAGQVKSMIYRDANNVGWYKVLSQGRMSDVKVGEQVRRYTTFNNNGGYDGITGNQEISYPANLGMTAALLAKAQPPSDRDATGYTVNNEYDANGNLEKVTHPDGSYEQWFYTPNNAVGYYRDRAGYVTVTERNANHNVVRVIRGMVDPTGGGNPTATPEAVQDIYGYYAAGHANEGMLAWTATTAYSGATFSAPQANERTDYFYNNNQRLVKILSPIPHGQSARPEVETTWVGNQKATEINQLDHTITYNYDALGRLTETLYADGTKTQTWYDDVNLAIYKKNRVDVVSMISYGPSGRLSATFQTWGRDADLTDLQLDHVNPKADRTSSFYYYMPGVSQPSRVYRDGTSTTNHYDYRGRLIKVTRPPRVDMALVTQTTFVDNQRFYTSQKTNLHEIRTYYGYSADRQTVRTIETRKPGVTFADNLAVLNATRVTTADPDYIINDAVRDIRGQIVQLIDPMDIETQSSYDALGRRLTQLRTKGALSLSNQSSYDAEGNVTQTISETGLVTDMTYDAANNLKSRTVAPGTALSATWDYTYSIDGRVETVTAPDSGVTTSIYQTCCGFTTGTRNAMGHGSVTNRNSQGQPVHTATLENFDSHSNLLDPTDSKTLAETTTKYRDDGRVQFRTVWKSPLGAIDRNDPPIAGIDGVAAADGVTTQYVYDKHIDDDANLDSAAGLAISTLGGGTAQVSIKAAVDQLALAPASGGAGISFGASGKIYSSGQATVVIAPDEKTMQVSITDGTGRNVMQATMTGPANSSPNQLINWTCNLYDQIDTTTAGIAALKTSAIDEDGQLTSTIADGFGRSVASLDQLGNKTTQSYDAGGNLLKTTDALTRDTDFTYDDLGRQLTITDALGNVRGTVYDASTGQVSSRTDAKNNSTSYVYDGLGRVSTETDRLGKITTKTYDDVGRLDTIKDAENHLTTYGFNLLGQRTSTALADGTAKTMTYDAAGRLLETELESGIKRTAIYEFSGVLDKMEYRNAGGILAGTDDYSYDAQLRRTGSTSRDGVTRELTYTDRGELDTDTTTYDGQSYPVDYDYDDRGRVQQIIYPSGRAAVYDYTDRGMLDTIDWDGSQIEDRSYNEVGLLTSVDRQAVDESRGYDELNRVTSIGNTNVGDASYTYDANGNKLSESWTGVMSDWNFTTQNAGDFPDGYDAEDRFRNFKQPAKNIDLYLERSNIGNVSNYELNGSVDGFRGYSNIHELTSVGGTNPTNGTAQTFDIDGNLTDSHTGIELDWDEAGMLTQTVVSSGDTGGIEGTNNYGYDASQKRVWKKIALNGSVVVHTVYIYAGPNCIAEYAAGSAASAPEQEYVYAEAIDSLVMLVRDGGSQKLTVTRNQQWSVSALADSSSGTVLERYSYDALGKRTILAGDGVTNRSSSLYDNPYGYTSRRHDEESGLMYYRARYYDWSTGEFCSKDPLEYVDGMSLYRAYMGLVSVDPSGEVTRPCTGIERKRFLAGCKKNCKRLDMTYNGGGLLFCFHTSTKLPIGKMTLNQINGACECTTSKGCLRSALLPLQLRKTAICGVRGCSGCDILNVDQCNRARAKEIAAKKCAAIRTLIQKCYSPTDKKYPGHQKAIDIATRKARNCGVFHALCKKRGTI